MERYEFVTNGIDCWVKDYEDGSIEVGDAEGMLASLEFDDQVEAVIGDYNDQLSGVIEESPIYQPDLYHELTDQYLIYPKFACIELATWAINTHPMHS